MKLFLKAIFMIFLISILYGTVTATMDRGMLDAGAELWQHLWFRATLVDIYCAFLTIYLWIAYKEKSFLSRLIWFVLIICLGTFAFSTYVLIQLFKLKPDDSFERILFKNT